MPKRDGRKPKPPLMLNGQCSGDECTSWKRRYDGTDYCVVAKNEIKRLSACPLKDKAYQSRVNMMKKLSEFEEGNNGTNV